MKKGRPAHTVSALATPRQRRAIRAVLFRETTTLGVRETPVAKTALAREFRSVDVDGQPIAVKLGRDDGRPAAERDAGVGRRGARRSGTGPAGEAGARPGAGGVRAAGPVGD